MTENRETRRNRPASASSGEHPFLVCTRDQFPELRARARREPWTTMKGNALQRVEKGLKMAETDRLVRRLQSFLAASALVYIVEPQRRSHIAGLVHDAITRGLMEIEFDEEQKWSGVVAPMGAAFLGIIALDIVYDDLNHGQVEECESVIQGQINRIDRKGAWALARHGTHGTWEIYSGERTSPDDAYYQHYLRQMTDDGVMVTATNYAWARLASTDGRLQKTGYADVLEFTGIDRRYYNNPRLKKFYRWLYGSSATPAKQLHAFGDFIPKDVRNAALAYRAGRFDPLAGRYMAWALEGMEPPGHVMAYVLKRKRYEPKVPTSQLYPNGGAFFREPEDSPESLAAALYNIVSPAMWHAHQETNAISLSAYGARLLMNGGWLGPVTRPAKMNNTLTINGKDHSTRSGGGLDEGLTGHGFDYTAGLSDEALPHGSSFTRSLLFTHAQDGASGYFIVLDEVEAAPGDRVYQYLHPSTDVRPQACRPETEYDAEINIFNEVKANRLAVFYGNEPERVICTSVPSGSERINRPDHYRLTAVYSVDEQDCARIPMVLFPHNKKHMKAEFKRIRNGGARGILISHHDTVSDRFYFSKGRSECCPGENMQFQGKAVFFRMVDDSVTLYFVRKGTAFQHGELGFFSYNPVSLHVRGISGRISATEKTTVTFIHPRIAGIRTDRQSLDVSEAGEGRIQVTIPPCNNWPVDLVVRST
ncbi:MAG: heparinase II/III family protein [Planctomycetes bacterium]|nr:heparinase II/III family protein [Planctomycetota bacterium]